MGRLIIAIAAATVLAVSIGVLAQTATTPLIGLWEGGVTGSFKAELAITGVGADGKVSGEMSFPSQSYKITFGAARDEAKKIGTGVFDGQKLAITTALGGLYELTLAGTILNGRYTSPKGATGDARFYKK